MYTSIHHDKLKLKYVAGTARLSFCLAIIYINMLQYTSLLKHFRILFETLPIFQIQCYLRISKYSLTKDFKCIIPDVYYD